jgi:hypothetical protein
MEETAIHSLQQIHTVHPRFTLTQRYSVMSQLDIAVRKESYDSFHTTVPYPIKTKTKTPLLCSAKKQKPKTADQRREKAKKKRKSQQRYEIK